ncbi:uncharacterized protein CELE_C32E8.4 [Caenorhabditis elegans]|uniref:Uncharacterized protein n=1 Tax=Caenorhabditis elegans TaxID=6239 RepID=P91126_CAEEL|nr:Uncharacterized protein CELE_C32E8.4 [Caenorhabditis elegans]CCD66402.1 Uncharacterized protein CELE_C32E8.4 [Caenorhabditis elegans]|eukprot:NP_491218.2 Uncharacterized protein CELE_C32E8.4 [Caenorhabditis elegans]
MYSLLTLLFVLFFSGSTLLVQCGGKKKGATSAEGKSSTMGPAPGGAPAAASAQGEPEEKE